MHCAHFVANRCQSCHWLDKPYAAQLALKQQQMLAQLAPAPDVEVLPAQASTQQGFRYKAKMVVQGSASAPLLGIVNQQQQAIDLCDCPLYPPSFAAVFAHCKTFISRANLQPYDIAARRGELKYLLLSQSLHSGQLMLRFVLRSKSQLAAIAQQLPWLQQQLPQLDVCSVNLQPLPAALLEGEEEILLSGTVLAEQLNRVPLYLQPQSFFQTHPVMAARLYHAAAQWVAALQQTQGAFGEIWDLFCGVGGFGLHIANPQQRLLGIEIAPRAIASASRSASELGLSQVQFLALDSVAFARAATQPPDLLIANPPRRGLGASLCQDIERLAPRWLLYSSCNAQSLAQDLLWLPRYRLIKVQLFDMFAHSSHFEVLTLLQRRDT